jgi:MobA-like NTP transferase domain
MGSAVLLVLAAGAGRRFGGCKQLAPVGPGGETLMDYTLYSAFRAGFGGAVVVIRPDLAGAMSEHFGPLRRSSIELVHQPPSSAGTVPAVLAARSRLGDDEPFAVVNADDLYPFAALQALRSSAGHAVLGFHLSDTVLPGSGPVHRALCRYDDDWRLLGLAEATVTLGGSGFVARDVVVPGDQLVSMNAWAFRPSIWAGLDAAPRAGEVLLPVVVDSLIARGAATVSVVPIAGRCVGITWPGELATVRDLVGRLVAVGDLPARISFA